MLSVRDKGINTWRQLKANEASNCVVYMLAWPGREFRLASWTEWLMSVGGWRDLRDRKVVPWWITAADLHGAMMVHQACFCLLSICQRVHLDTTWAFCSGLQHALRKSWKLWTLIVLWLMGVFNKCYLLICLLAHQTSFWKWNGEKRKVKCAPFSTQPAFQSPLHQCWWPLPIYSDFRNFLLYPPIYLNPWYTTAMNFTAKGYPNISNIKKVLTCLVWLIDFFK